MKLERTAVSMMLLALAAANAVQDVVVCVGADGHVALEPAAHHHRIREACESDAVPPTFVSHVEGHPHVACPPACTDIPICAEFNVLQPVDGSATTSHHTILGPGPAGTLQLDSLCAAAYAFTRDLPSCTHSLRSVVLQV